LFNYRVAKRGHNEKEIAVLEKADRGSLADLQLSDAQSLRQRCRNPRCRAKLPVSVADARGAFCCPGCYAHFFRTRCRVCEAPIEQPARGTRLTCNKVKCKNAWRTRTDFDPGRYPTLNAVKSFSERPVNKGPKVGISDDRASSWRVVAAGAPITANQYHCATVGAAEAIASVARTNAAHWRAAKAGRRGYRGELPSQFAAPPSEQEVVS
jgi:hypothetical protein